MPPSVCSITGHSPTQNSPMQLAVIASWLGRRSKVAMTLLASWESGIISGSGQRSLTCTLQDRTPGTGWLSKPIRMFLKLSLGVVFSYAALCSGLLFIFTESCLWNEHRIPTFLQGSGCEEDCRNPVCMKVPCCAQRLGIRECRDGLESKHTFHQALRPEFKPQDLHNRRWKPNTASCSLTPVCTQIHKLTHTHAYIHTH